MEVLLNAVLSVWLIASPTPAPAEYTVREPGGGMLIYHPARGWVAPSECPWGCYNPADTKVNLLQGEITLETLADLNATVYRNGKPVVWFYRFFGNRAVYSVAP